MPKLGPDPHPFLTPAHRETGPESSSADRQPDELSYAGGLSKWSRADDRKGACILQIWLKAR